MLSAGPVASDGGTVGTAVAEPVAVTGGDAVGLTVGMALTVDDTEAVVPRDSDAVAVFVAVRVLVDVDESDGDGDAEHRRRIFVDDAAVSDTDARVLFAASRMLMVKLMARVAQLLAMPAAVHAAGGVQHDTMGARL